MSLSPTEGNDMEQPRCDYIPLWASVDSRCPHPASVRVLRSHNGGFDPDYRNRCLFHARRELGPSVAAVWNASEQTWLPADR
jgi:hypothetical protein